MDYQQLIQRNLKKITIGLAIVGVASLTIWYMRNQHHAESEAPIGQIPNYDIDNTDDTKEDLISASRKIAAPESQSESKQTQDDNDIDNDTNESSAASAPKKKKKKKKVDAQARMQKLLAKQNKRHGQSQPDGDNAPDYDSEDDSNLDPDSKDWKQFVQLLSIKGIVLRPQILFDFIALEVKSFIGANVTITISREVNTNQSTSTAKDSVIARIEGFIPIINNAKYHVLNTLDGDDEDEKGDNMGLDDEDEKGDNMGLDDFGGYDLGKEREYKAERAAIADLKNVGRNELGFGIITKRSSKVRSKYKMTWNPMDYVIFPSFLNKYYKWNVNDSLYFSTLYKNFSDTMAEQANINPTPWAASRRKIDDTYFNTGNIVNGFVVFLNRKMTRKMCIIQGEGGLYHTDDRIKYRNLKVPMDVDKNNDKIALCQQIWTMKNDKDIAKVFVQGEDSNLFLVYVVKPKKVQAKEKIEVHKIDINMNATGKDKYTQFGVKMTDLSNQLTADYLKKFPYHQADVVPGYYGSNDEETSDIRNISNPLVIGEKVAKGYNDILKQHELLTISLKHKYNKISSYANTTDSKKRSSTSMLEPLGEGFNFQFAYLDEQDNGKYAVLYMMGMKMDKKTKWNLFLRVNGKKRNKENMDNYNNKFMQFLKANKSIKEDGCDIMFCDERVPDNKKLIGIFGEQMLVLSMYNNNKSYGGDDEKDNDNEPIARIYNVKDVVPDLFAVETKTSKNKYINEKTTNIVRGGKWYYSYDTQTLYVFERVSTSSKYPFRLRRLSLHTFKFE